MVVTDRTSAPRSQRHNGGMSANQLHVNAAELLREPGLRRHVSAVVEPTDVEAAHDADRR